MKFRSIVLSPYYFARALRTLGWRHTAILIGKRIIGVGHTSNDSETLVDAHTAAKVDWTNPPQHHLTVVDRPGPYEVAWITSPPSPGSGGHQNMWRFIRTLEEAGHRCTVYLYDWRGSKLDPRAIRKHIEGFGNFPVLDAQWLAYDGSVKEGTDAIFATAWETAYQAWIDPTPAKRFYFVQDFEPWFYPVGTNHALAEATYHFGFHGLTAGGWLKHKLSSEFGMQSEHYDFAADSDLYFPLDGSPRDGVFFYARPSTPRRGFELGIAALELFAEQRPNTPIHLAGGDFDPAAVNFDHTNHSTLPLSALNGLYNKCAAALVLSFSNMSLLPLEVMAAGVVPVMNKADNNSMVSSNPHIKYVPPSPKALADALVAAVDAASEQHARKVAQSVSTWTWKDSGKQFVSAFEGAMRG